MHSDSAHLAKLKHGPTVDEHGLHHLVSVQFYNALGACTDVCSEDSYDKLYHGADSNDLLKLFPWEFSYVLVEPRVKFALLVVCSRYNLSVRRCNNASKDEVFRVYWAYNELYVYGRERMHDAYGLVCASSCLLASVVLFLVGPLGILHR